MVYAILVFFICFALLNWITNYFDPLFRYTIVNVTKNRFFRLAIDRAAKLAGKPGRILSLLAQLAVKLSQTKNSITVNAIREHSLLIGRMVKAHVTGAYKIKSVRIFIILLAAIIYFINPIDLIPDFIFGIGLTDDLAVLMWVYRAAAEEIASFRNFEKSTVNPETVN